MKKILRSAIARSFLSLLVVTFSIGLLLGACSPKVGSPEWCKDMKENPKGDWSSNEAAEFAKNCLF